ncbi:lipoprotein [Streptomyces sp. CC208A]|uniref:lipoprotein n=1 Tax=Streptomyces sp. CC208A TaxID=3044573 RepID=UPI0024A7DDB6|nr:lipoprotein [Streptomyces sp. CC208A]
MPERSPLLATVAVAALGLLLTGCGGTEQEAAAPPTKATPATPTPTTPAVAAAGGSLGGPGTACSLPVSFSFAEDWKPKAVSPPADPDFAELLRQGPATVVCEVNAKGAGHIGFLRVWTAPKGPAKATLTAFVKAEKGSKGLALTDTTAGGLPVVEARYSVHVELLDEDKEKRSFAVETAKGTVVVELGGLDPEEHRAMIPAYELAKSTLKLS